MNLKELEEKIVYHRELCEEHRKEFHFHYNKIQECKKELSDLQLEVIDIEPGLIIEIVNDVHLGNYFFDESTNIQITSVSDRFVYGKKIDGRIRKKRKKNDWPNVNSFQLGKKKFAVLCTHGTELNKLIEREKSLDDLGIT